MDNLFDNSEVREMNIMKPELRKEGCHMTGIKMNDDKSVTFSFVDKNKNVLNQRYFKPSRQVGEKTLTDDEFKSNIRLNISAIAHIARAFLTEETFKGIKIEDGGNLGKIDQNWEKYINMTGAALSAANYKNVECALKVVYRVNKGKYYSALPQVPDFISTANHPKDFVANPEYDKFEMVASRPDQERLPNQEGAQGATPPAGAPSAGAGW